MGIVYRAEDIALSRVVALKMIAPDLASKDSFLRRFQSEARALARVDSPFIVRIHAMRKSGDHFFIVMEFVDGGTLSAELHNGAMDMSRAQTILRQMLKAFSHAHGVGVIHRDIKPSNIMLSREGRVKVTDFGLAKLRREDGHSTVTQGIAGTARYMSPEQIHGGQIDQRSDIYSLGMTMYEMLAGKLPFDPEEGTYSILKRIVEETFPRVDVINPEVSSELAQVIARAIEKSPEDRYQSADEMLEAVEMAFNDETEPQLVESPSIRHAPTRSIRKAPFIGWPSGGDRTAPFRNPLVLALIAIVLLIYPVYLLIDRGLSGGDDTIQTPVDPSVSQNGEPNPIDAGAQAATINVESSPDGAVVYLNGHEAGDTPLRNFPVDPGDVELSVVLEGYEQESKFLTLEAGEEWTEQITLVKAPPPVEDDPIGEDPVIVENDPVTPPPDPDSVVRGSMRLRAEPGGRIEVDGRAYANEVSDQWPVGQYTVRFVDAGDPSIYRETTVTLRQGDPVDLTCYFRFEVSIQALENGNSSFATATIRGNGIDREEYVPVSLELESGTYTITASRHDYTIDDPVRELVLEPTFDRLLTQRRIKFSIQPE